MDKNSKLKRNINSQFVQLRLNGKYFPSWVSKNFKKYKLPEIISTNEDLCNKKQDSKKELRKYQEFLGKFFDPKSPYNDLLVYHGVGSGKTISVINIYNILYNYTPGWNFFILLPASLKNDPWIKNIKLWLSKDKYNDRYNNIIFVHFDSPFAGKDFLEAVRKSDPSKKNLFVIDEVHNFISNVYNNLSSNRTGRAITIYDYIIKSKKDGDDVRILALSATPAINKPFELGILFNLLRVNIFPNNENEFNHLFISDEIFPIINSKNKNMFQRRILGLVSYYIGATPEYYAEKVFNIDVKMSKYQEDVYDHYKALEAKQNKNTKSGSSVYKSYTRQASNFVFPMIDQKRNGFNRPRPAKFRLKSKIILKLDEGKEDLNINKKSDKSKNISAYLNEIKNYINGFKNLIKKIEIDKNNKYTLQNDIDKYLKVYNSDFKKFNKESSKRSEVYKLLYKCSPKIINVIFRILISKGPVIIYSNYVLVEGLEILKIYLEQFGFYNYFNEKGKKGFAYSEFHGGIKDKNQREKSRQIFNEKENLYGDKIKIMLISPAATEGISLNSVRQIHILEPYWNEVRIEQIIGRAHRQCAHKYLPMNERKIVVYRYRSVKNNGELSTDEYLQESAIGKSKLINSFLDTIKEAAIDCTINRNHNMIVNEYKCFQFNEDSLLNDYVGPAYKQDLKDDIKFNNGSNSSNSITQKIKVREINAVMALNEDEDNQQYSSPQKYWFFEKTGVVYDYDLYFPVGKVSLKDCIPNKLDKDTYIIDYVVNIPILYK